ncbi:unnamed protein product [Bursaphelenchus okinawaensis]|uniref:receptor protein serine/threonine kinase n=1 Tax=Bursaphelenchus okinawaensis TaxID=465554 RepID=A0A811KQA4_9BILA|nr:unnamed protein product [Bursaphelenchus okinawaensis]CAG9111231.1 unnamed protein product [Bursaphelenchus okinawaensis]
MITLPRPNKTFCLLVFTLLSIDLINAKNVQKRFLSNGPPLHPESYNHHIIDTENVIASNVCFCSYGDYCEYNQTCLKHEKAACYHLMEERYDEERRAMITLHSYGCAALEAGSEASELTCQSYRSHHSVPTSIACCYEGNYCNLNITPPKYSNVVESDGFDENVFLLHNYERLILFIVVAVVCGSVLYIAVVLILKCLKRSGKIKNSLPNQNALLGLQDNEKSYCGSECTWESGSGSGSGLVTLNQRTIALNLTMLELVARGRYGEVRRAIYRDTIVAVKTFYTTEEESWKNERDVYQTQMLNHENILQYVASDISSNIDSLTQMLLITDYHSLGSLYDYLRKSEPLTLQEALGHIQGICAGLEHLHNAVHGTGSRRKPQIAHRDIKSKNIIVKRRGVCCIADFGLAVRLEEDCILPAKLNVQVGTKRYMAPEILNNALNVKHFDEFKMADIYSFALVIWEIINRIQTPKSNVYQRTHKRMVSFSSSSGIATSSGTSYSPLRYRPSLELYRSRDSCNTTIEARPPSLPYQNLVESDPSFEEMRLCVCEHKKRPLLEEEWTNGSNAVLRDLTDIMKECWSENAKSRHTAYKMKKEINELMEMAHLMDDDVIPADAKALRTELNYSQSVLNPNINIV